MPLTATHRPDAAIVLHGFKLSGYSHRAELFLELLGLPCEFRQVDLAGAQPSLADVAVYPYVAYAPEGNVSLDDYPQVRAWLARVEALSGFVAMPVSPVGLRA